MLYGRLDVLQGDGHPWVAGGARLSMQLIEMHLVH